MLSLYGCQSGPVTPSAQDVDDPALNLALRQVLAAHHIGPLDPGPKPDPAKVKLGQMLFFDRELSGNRDISCATCHHPQFATGDGIPLSIGTGSLGLGPERQRGAMRSFIPRNAPELFNRGSPEWHTMFWDGRVMGTVAQGFVKPYEFEDLVALPEGLDSLLAAQALFPVTSAAEMRGERADLDALGQPNELGWLDDEDLPQIPHPAPAQRGLHRAVDAQRRLLDPGSGRPPLSRPRGRPGTVRSYPPPA